MKHEIEMPDFPEGWRAVAYRCPKKFEQYFDLEEKKIITAAFDHGSARLVIEKIKPRRIVLEETEEDNHEFHDLCGGSSYADQYIDDICLSNKAKIWRIVEEE